MMKAIKLILSILALLISANTFAQSITEEGLRTQALNDWERAKAYTKEYLDAMPEKGMSFKPTPEVRSFSEQMLHLAQTNFLLGALSTGEKPLYADQNMEKMNELKTKEALTKKVIESYDFVITGIKNMEPAKLSNKVTLERFNITTSQLEWLNKSFEHQTHHRGQCTVYLRLMGITPPQEKLF
jgi:uncharacterized damage-inducible protein DinB